MIKKLRIPNPDPDPYPELLSSSQIAPSELQLAIYGYGSGALLSSDLRDGVNFEIQIDRGEYTGRKIQDTNKYRYITWHTIIT